MLQLHIVPSISSFIVFRVIVLFFIFLGVWSVLFVKLVGSFPWIRVSSFLASKNMALFAGGLSLLDNSAFTVPMSLEQLSLRVSVCKTRSDFYAYDLEKIYLFQGLVALFWGLLDVFFEYHRLQPLFKFFLVGDACQPLRLWLSLRSFPRG